MSYHWLLLRSGQLVIGTKGDDRYSWATLDASGYHGAVNPSEVLEARPLRPPAGMRDKWAR